MRLVLPRRGIIPAGAAALVLLLVLLPAGASAAEPAGVDLSGGCTVALTSLDASGGVIDSAMGPATADRSNPLDVAFDGTIEWEGTAPLLRTGSYQVTLNGAPVPGFGGPIDNKDGVTSASGAADVGSVLGTFAFMQSWVSLTLEIAGSVTSPDGGCSGHAWIRTGKADPLFSGGSIGGLALGALGALGLLKSLKGRHAGRGLAAGLILGIALALLVMTFGVYVVGPLTPWAVLGSVPILGFVIGLISFG